MNNFVSPSRISVIDILRENAFNIQGNKKKGVLNKKREGGDERIK
jgi:hypothetical protein